MIESVTTQPQTSFNVLLIGDSCKDKYNIGTVDRLSPEAPVPVLKITDTFDVSGMAANVKLNLQNLGIDPDFITNGEEIIKSRFIDKRSGQHLLRVDDEHRVCAWSGVTPFPLDSYDAIVISDYNKGFLTYENIQNVIAKSTCPIFIDTKKIELAEFSSERTFIKINELEYKNSRSIPSQLIVTLGDRGAMLKLPQTETLFGTKPVEVMDVCGCGDTFLAALAYQYLMTKNIESAIIFANIAASITVQHRGNYAPTLEEVNSDRY